MASKHDQDASIAAEPIKVWEQYSKLTIVLNYINKDTQLNQLMTKAFEEVYKRNKDKLRILIQQTRLQEAAHDPVVCVIDTQSKAMVSQTFNFIDVLGGKQLINADNIERFFAIRGVFQPKGEDLELIQKGRREAETYNFMTQVSPCAGPDFAFEHEKLATFNAQVEEMDRVDVIDVDPATFQYPEEIVSVFRQIADPFGNQLTEVSYEPNPTDMTSLTKTIGFASEQPDGVQESK